MKYLKTLVSAVKNRRWWTKTIKLKKNKTGSWSERGGIARGWKKERERLTWAVEALFVVESLIALRALGGLAWADGCEEVTINRLLVLFLGIFFLFLLLSVLFLHRLKQHAEIKHMTYRGTAQSKFSFKFGSDPFSATTTCGMCCISKDLIMSLKKDVLFGIQQITNHS